MITSGKSKKDLEKEISELRKRMALLQAAEAQRTALEQALEKSEIKFRTLTEKSVVGVYLIQDGIFRYVNPKLAEIFGYEPGELIDKTQVLSVVFQEDRHLLDENLRKRLSGQVDSMNYQFRGVRKDGSVIHIEAYGSRMDYQEAPAVIGSLIDITHRIDSEEALRKSERRYKTLVEEINDGYFVVQDQRITFANQAFCRMHLTSLKQVLGRPFMDFVSPDCRERLLETYTEVLGGRPSDGQIQYARAGVPENQSATEVRARVVDLGEGLVIIGICRDISDRVAMESKVREHERMAYLGHLSASLSHEIRNPLSSIKMNLQILTRKLDLDGYDRRRLEITVHEVSRLEGILRQLLDLARPLTVETAPVNLSALAQGCVDLLQAKAQEKHVRIDERYPSELPLAPLDAGKLEQALINLLLNAIEATPEGGSIRIWTKATGNAENLSLELGVRDTGPGIEQNQMCHLFTPFYTSKNHGCGLGLSNVKRIVDAHSGKVEVRSRKGKGATFVLMLPCRT
ncbi:MAG: PAS domain S-box protein [Desulfomonile tiedjei]|uniref:histidine kinase n=1 Tax=Desulfomonile tiedjei TaxID=2358 RepID=A0A9D6UZH5_9BACT|nr:PAS domain S-box protein [Desulfomonile tiedjei]